MSDICLRFTHMEVTQMSNVMPESVSATCVDLLRCARRNGSRDGWKKWHI